MLAQNKNVKAELSEDEKDKLCKAALGLTLQEAESAFALAMVNDGSMDMKDLPIILEEKVQVIKKTGILEFIKSEYTIKDIGGLDNLKNGFLNVIIPGLNKLRDIVFSLQKEFLLQGFPGCGKSLTAKAMSTIWQLPLLKLDFGKSIFRTCWKFRRKI